MTRSLIDTNVFLRASDASSLQHQVCVDALAALARRGGAVVCAQVIIEFWVAATRPRNVNGIEMTFDAAGQTVADILNTFQCLDEAPRIIELWNGLRTMHRVLGKPAHDARLIALMQFHRIRRLVTINVADFKRYRDVDCVTPDQVVTTVP